MGVCVDCAAWFAVAQTRHAICIHHTDCMETGVSVKPCNRNVHLKLMRRLIMAWSKPEFTDLRFGFEITMYIANR
jgi:coenzyme PQQ precursor peptide PqqA